MMMGALGLISMGAVDSMGDANCWHGGLDGSRCGLNGSHRRLDERQCGLDGSHCGLNERIVGWAIDCESIVIEAIISGTIDGKLIIS